MTRRRLSRAPGLGTQVVAWLLVMLVAGTAVGIGFGSLMRLGGLWFGDD